MSNGTNTILLVFFTSFLLRLVVLSHKKRSIQVEGVFGVLKEDYGFRRFLTRGKKNIEMQFFLLAFALKYPETIAALI